MLSERDQVPWCDIAYHYQGHQIFVFNRTVWWATKGSPAAAQRDALRLIAGARALATSDRTRVATKYHFAAEVPEIRVLQPSRGRSSVRLCVCLRKRLAQSGRKWRLACPARQTELKLWPINPIDLQRQPLRSIAQIDGVPQRLVKQVC
jgi:hypothetical protein